uniref:ATP-binding cassette, sub-family F (GCN20), member 2b n=1 Tax=Sinocyclocheilus anshuiensis TaxID=1608454 RepID=A0A671SXG1_9TELE
MPSDLAKKKAAKKKEAAKTRQRVKKHDDVNGEGELHDGQVNGAVTNGETNEGELDEFEMRKMEARAVTGVLASHPNSTDVHISSLSLTFHGQELLSDTSLELNSGRHYGLIGLNGTGMENGLEYLTLAHNPETKNHKDPTPSDRETLRGFMFECPGDPLCPVEAECEKLMEIYERLEELDADKAEVRASRILFGLGFTPAMQQKKLTDFSGGWRMCVSLASFKRILVLISHSQDFLNGVCTNIIHLHQRKLKYYTKCCSTTFTCSGNYDQYVKTREELEGNQMKRYNWEQDQIAHMKNYIARFGHGSAKLARQAQSKEKTLQKMVASGLTARVVNDKVLTCGQQIFNQILLFFKIYYFLQHFIYKNVEFGIDLDTQVALVGPNGAGKFTLLKLLMGELLPTDGMKRKHSHVKIGRYHQVLERLVSCSFKVLAIVCLAWQNPHMLFLDEPTNHLDIETIDALAEAINEFEGGMMLVSHDFRLIQQVCEKQTITKWNGDILAYKEHLKSKIDKQTHDI